MLSPPFSFINDDALVGFVCVGQASPTKVVHGVLGPAFIPNLVSNAVFLMATIQSVSVSVVNFKGRPFMAGVYVAAAADDDAVAHGSYVIDVALKETNCRNGETRGAAEIMLIVWCC